MLLSLYASLSFSLHPVNLQLCPGSSFHQLRCFYSGELHAIKVGIFFLPSAKNSLGLVQIKKAVCLRNLPGVTQSQICQC